MFIIKNVSYPCAHNLLGVLSNITKKNGNFCPKQFFSTSFSLCTQCVCVLVTQLCPALGNPWTAAHQAPLSMGFSRQEHWNGLLLPSPGDLPDPGIKPRSPVLWAYSLPSEPPGKPYLSPTAAVLRKYKFSPSVKVKYN